ncbi:hypothetical protein BDV33DRAFT_184414, partial [Aspergillus novoparasiticus]
QFVKEDEMVGGRCQITSWDSVARHPRSFGVGGMGGEQSSYEPSCRASVNKKPYDNLSCRMMMTRLVDWPRVVVVIVVANT